MSESIAVIAMNKIVELPLVEPLYSTYHNQGPGSAILVNNPTIRNWYLNQVLMLSCDRKFLSGFTSPSVSVVDSNWMSNPHLENKMYHLVYLKGCTNSVIKNLLDAGYYVYFAGVDDYYIEGKSWYKERHFIHDGCICGYDSSEKSFCIYAYDDKWIYRKFWTSQKSFNTARRLGMQENKFGYICGLKPRGDKVVFSEKQALQKISVYLDSDLIKYPEDEEGDVYGIVVHDYICKYIGKLYDGSIPYERMDRRVFRLIWEHKKVMLERIQCIEDELGLDHDISDKYKTVVNDSNTIRMLYASHYMKRRDSVLPVIQKKLLSIKELEQALLNELLEKTKGDEAI